MTIGSATVKALYDTGAGPNCIRPDVFERAKSEGAVGPRVDGAAGIRVANGQQVEGPGTFMITATVAGRSYTGPFAVMPALTSPVIFGMRAAVDLQLDYSAVDHRFVFRNVSAVHVTDDVAQVLVHRKVRIPPRRARRVPLQVIMQGRAVSNQDIVASVNESDVLTQTNDVGVFTVLISNPSNEPIIYNRTHRVGFAESYQKFSPDPVPQAQVDALCSATNTSSRSPGSSQSSPSPSGPPPKDIRDKLSPLIHDATKHLDAATRKLVQDHLWRRWRTISADKFDLGLADTYQHTIHLSDTKPVYHKQFPIPLDHAPIIQEHVEKWLKMGVVEPATSRYNSPIFCVKKKDGGFRLCLDYRGVNACSLPENYSIRTPDDAMAEVGQAGARYFVALDLSSGFYQMGLAKESRPVTAFTVPTHGQLQWTRGAMGLKGCPGSFSRLMDRVLQGVKNTIIYIDDVLVYGRTPEETLRHLDSVLARLEQHNLKINVSKSSFLQPETAYLGHVLSVAGISPGKEKAKAIREAKPPVTVQQLKSFLGITNYFRSFVKRFAHKAGKLYALTRKDSPWKGGPLPPYALDTFRLLQKEIANTTPRAFPFSTGKFHLFVDGASGDDKAEGGLGGHLLQEDSKGQLQTIAFCSRQLLKHEKNYTAFLLELQAAVYAIDYFQFYLKGRTFTLYTDHAPLTTLSTVHTKTLHRLHALLNEHSFDMKHIPGKLNPVADFLSRSHGPADTVNVSAIDTRPDTLRSHQLADPVLGPILKQLQTGQTPTFPPSMAKVKSRIGVTEGILTIMLPARAGFFDDLKHRAILPPSLQTAVLKEAHDSNLGGHQGIFRTMERIKGSFWWPNMEDTVSTHLHNCTPCQATSNKDKPPQHPHDQYEGARGPNHRVHVDLFGPIFDKEGKKQFILGMTDAFTKLLRLTVIPHKSAALTATAIWTDWIAIYGVPKTIVSDQGTEFNNELQHALWKILKIEHKMTSPYWPVCNQQQEHQNKTLQHYLRCVINAARKRSTDWAFYLPALMLSVNTAVNKATKQAPFNTMFGYDARLPLWSDLDILKGNDYKLKPDENDLLYDWHDSRKAAHRAAYQSAQKYAEDTADPSSDTDVSYKHGDPVWIERPVITDKNKKFAHKWEPAVIIKRTGPHTYKIRKTDTKARKKINVLNSAHIKPRRETPRTSHKDDDDGDDDDLDEDDESIVDDAETAGEEEEDDEDNVDAAVPPPTTNVNAVKYRWRGQDYSFDEYIGTRLDMSIKAWMETLDKAARDTRPDYEPRGWIRLPHPPGPAAGWAPHPPPPPPFAHGGGGGGGGGGGPPPPPPVAVPHGPPPPAHPPPHAAPAAAHLPPPPPPGPPPPPPAPYGPIQDPLRAAAAARDSDQSMSTGGDSPSPPGRYQPPTAFQYPAQTPANQQQLQQQQQQQQQLYAQQQQQHLYEQQQQQHLYEQQRQQFLHQLRQPPQQPPLLVYPGQEGPPPQSPPPLLPPTHPPGEEYLPQQQQQLPPLPPALQPGEWPPGYRTSPVRGATHAPPRTAPAWMYDINWTAPPSTIAAPQDWEWAPPHMLSPHTSPSAQDTQTTSPTAPGTPPAQQQQQQQHQPTRDLTPEAVIHINRRRPASPTPAPPPTAQEQASQTSPVPDGAAAAPPPQAQPDAQQEVPVQVGQGVKRPLETSPSKQPTGKNRKGLIEMLRRRRQNERTPSPPRAPDRPAPIRRSNIRANLFPELQGERSPREILARPQPVTPPAASPPPPTPPPRDQRQQAPPPPPRPAEATKRQHSPPTAREQEQQAQAAKQANLTNTGPVYHVPLEPLPSITDNVARIAAPPRLLFPNNLPKPATDREVQTAINTAHRYHRLFDAARARFLARAAERVPREARHHDRGHTWSRYHEHIFDTVNPQPRAVYNHVVGGQPMPTYFHPTARQPASVRWGIIQENQLQLITNDAELKKFFQNGNKKDSAKK